MIRKYRKGPNYITAELKCNKTRVAGLKSPQGKRFHTTLPAKKEDACCFSLTCYFCTTHKLWFLRKHGPHNWDHWGHPPVDKRFINAGMESVSPEMKRVAGTLLEKHVPPAIVSILLEVAEGKKVSVTKLESVRRAVTLNKHRNHQDESTADTTLRILENEARENGLKYVVLMASYDRAKNLVKVRSRKPRNNSRNHHLDIGFEELEQVSRDKDTNRFVKAVVEALQLEDGNILLGVAWATKESQKWFEKFHDVLGFDVKYGTNNEKRPLFRVVGKTINDKNIPLINGYLPSQQKYAFTWVFEKAIPGCLPARFLRRVSVMISDDDPHQGAALDMVRESPERLYGSVHIFKRCKWHKVRIYMFCQ